MCSQRVAGASTTFLSKAISLAIAPRTICKIADEFEDDLIDDNVRKGWKNAERSSVSAC